MISPNEENAARQTQTAAGLQRRGAILLFLALGALCGLTFLCDDAAMRFLAEHRTKGLKNVAGVISNFGDWPWLMASALPFLVWAWWKKRRTLFRLVALMMIASTLAGLAANSLRLTTGRTRPNNKAVAPGWYGLRHEGKWLLGKNKFASFPSGHTATAVGFLAVLGLRRRPAAWLWFVPAVVMALSRMIIDAHHLSDVCFGAWIGVVVAWWCLEKARPPALADERSGVENGETSV